MSTIQHDVVDNAAEGRFEIGDPAGLSLLQYVRKGDAVHLTHTEVPKALEGQGRASALTHAALEAAKRDGVKVVPSCPFAAAYVRRHPEYAALVASSGGGGA